MSHKHVELFFGSILCLIFYVSVVLLVAGLVQVGFTGQWAILQLVGMLLGLSFLVLGCVPVVAALLVTGGKRLAGDRSVRLSDSWITCAGCTLIVACYRGGLVWLYDRLVHPVLR